MTAAEQEYADALARAIVQSVKVDSPPGDLVRIIIRWFEGPDYLTVHALGSDEEGEVAPGDAWYPLEWRNEDREINRIDTVMEDARLARAVESLATELGEDGWSWDEQPAALIAAGSEIRRLVEEARLPVAAHFAIGVCHFEGWGATESVPRANPQAVVAALHGRGLAPEE